MMLGIALKILVGDRGKYLVPAATSSSRSGN
jgi:hypothetical protein